MHKSILNNIFETTMKREHHTATTFTTGEEFECFFRRSNDNLNKHDTMVMYYRVNAPMQVGTLIKFGGYTFLALNKETTENTVYHKSALIRTNGTINTHNFSVVNLPFYSDGINNNNAANSTHLSIIDGDAELLTEDNSLSRKLKINDLLNIWKRTLKITNLFYIDNICHVIVKINSDITPNVGYKAVLSALSSLHVKPGDTDKITSIVYINDAKVEDATIFYESSDEQIATIDENGNIEYLTDGMVFFIATWTEQGISAKTDTVTVTAEQTDDNVTIYMDSISEIYNGLESDFSCYAVKNGLRDVNIAVSIRVENLSGSINQEAYIKLIKISKLSNGKYQIFVDNSNMVYRTIGRSQEVNSNRHGLLFDLTKNGNYIGIGYQSDEKEDLYNVKLAYDADKNKLQMFCDTEINGNLSVQGSFTNPSDITLKTNIDDTKIDALDKLNQIELKEFDWIENNEHENIGIIAQQLQDILPELVCEDSETGKLSIKTTKFVPYLIKAIQELSSLVENKNKS